MHTAAAAVSEKWFHALLGSIHLQGAERSTKAVDAQSASGFFHSVEGGGLSALSIIESSIDSCVIAKANIRPQYIKRGGIL